MEVFSPTSMNRAKINNVLCGTNLGHKICENYIKGISKSNANILIIRLQKAALISSGKVSYETALKTTSHVIILCLFVILSMQC